MLRAPLKSTHLGWQSMAEGTCYLMTSQYTAATLILTFMQWLIDPFWLVQAMMRAPLESTHLGFKSALVTHALCGQLAGLERHCAEADTRSLAACAKVMPSVPSAAHAEKNGCAPLERHPRPGLPAIDGSTEAAKFWTVSLYA